MNSSETQETPANASPAPAETNAAENETKSNEAAPAPAAHAPAPAASSASAHADDNDADEGDDAEGGDEAAAGGAPAADGTPGDPTKKKRRRRRRKKHGATPEGAAAGANGEGASAGEAAVSGAEGAAATNGEARKADGNKKKNDRGDKKKGGKPHHDPHRERPAFAVGDVVFGKILDIGEDAIFVDVAGKAKAVFDKLELLLPEDMADTVEEDARKAEAEAEAIMRGGKPGEEPAAEEAPAEEGEATEAAETTEHVEAASAPAPTEGETTEAAAPAEGAEANGEAAAAAPSGEEAKPGIVQLPRVVLEAGATFVGVVHNDGGRGGMIVLTHHPKRAGKAKPAVAAAFKNKTEIFGLVTGVIKGGVEVDVDGLRAFAPGSHMSLHLGHDLHHLVGKRLPFSVTQYAKRGRDVVLSRKAVLEVEAKAARELALSKVKPGDTVEGTVRSIVPFGAFVDIGGVEGLVSLSEMSHNRSDSPSDIFKVGKKTSVLIQKIDDKGKIWLSHKATIPDPWGDVATKYAVGTKHTGKVVRIQPFGAFLELESGVDGLIHTSDLFGLPPKPDYVKPVADKAVEKPVAKPVERNDRRPGGDKRGDRGDRGASSSSSNSRIDHPNEFVAVGDSLDVVVSSLDTGTHKIALHPAPTGDAANEAAQRVQLHKMVKVVVVAAEASGLVVRVLGATGRNSRGYITGAATGTPRGTELRKLFPVGKELEAKVIEIDPRRGEAKLSLKAVQQDTERNAYQQYRQQVKREAKFGTFGDLLNQATAKKNPQK